MPSFKNIKKKKLLTLLLLIAGGILAYSQNYDLIVKTNGDSIACRIDSITDSNIYFEMINRNYWINTSIDRTSVVEYQYNAIDQNAFVFKEGTSYIEKKSNTATKHGPLKNSLYIGSHLLTVDFLYERTIPLGNNIGLIAGGGIIQQFGFSDATNLVGKIDLILGGSKHFFETGIDIAPLKNDIGLLSFPIGYRYQNPKGFLLKIELLFIVDSGTTRYGEKWTDIYQFPGVSLGYSF